MLEQPSVLQPLNSSSPLSGSALLSSFATWQLQPSLLFLPLLQAPTVLPTIPYPSPFLQDLPSSSCSLPSPIPSPHSCHVAGLSWALSTIGLLSLWSADQPTQHGRYQALDFRLLWTAPTGLWWPKLLWSLPVTHIFHFPEFYNWHSRCLWELETWNLYN